MSGLGSEYDKGIAHLEGGDFPAALIALRAVMDIVRGNEQIARALVRVGRGSAQAAMRLPLETAEARQLYECSLAAYLAIGGTITDPADCRLLRAVCFNLGSHCAGHKLNAEAIRYYRDAWLLSPDHEDTPNNLAQILIMDGQPLEALALLEEAMQLHPNSAVLRHRKGEALKAVGRTA